MGVFFCSLKLFNLFSRIIFCFIGILQKTPNQKIPQSNKIEKRVHVIQIKLGFFI